VLIGDGVSDLAARPAVQAIIGFGGVVTRQRVAIEADVFIKVNSLAPVLPLALSQTEQKRLSATPYESVRIAGLSFIEAGEVVFNK
jgi:hypothetical protein